MTDVAFIQWCGGMVNFLLLREDARLFDLFVIAWQGEAEANRIRQMQKAQ